MWVDDGGTVIYDSFADINCFVVCVVGVVDTTSFEVKPHQRPGVCSGGLTRMMSNIGNKRDSPEGVP